MNIGGDMVGHDKIIQTITNFLGIDTEQQRTLRNRHNMLELVKNTYNTKTGSIESGGA